MPLHFPQARRYLRPQKALLILIRHRLRWGGDDGGGCRLPPLTCSKITGGVVMPIKGLLRSGVFNPEEIKVLSTAFEDTLRELGLADRSDPLTEIVAKKIIELAHQGERDPGRLREQAVRSLSG
jgi:hypothetical protein